MPQSQHGPAQLGPLPQPPQSPIPARSASRLLPVLGVVLGLLGLVLGAAAWFRAGQSTSNPPYSDQQVAAAKEALCNAHLQSWRSAQVAGSKKPDNPEAAMPVVAVNGRVAEVAVGNFLVNSVDANPAAPTELKNLITQLGFAYQNIVLTQLSDGTNAEVAPIGEEADRVKLKIDQICQ